MPNAIMEIANVDDIADKVGNCGILPRKVQDDIKVDFALVVDGNGMAEDGIDNGEMVYMRKVNLDDVGDGDIAAVQINYRMILGHIYKDGGDIEIRYKNPLYPTILITKEEQKDFILLGRVVAYSKTPKIRKQEQREGVGGVA